MSRELLCVVADRQWGLRRVTYGSGPQRVQRTPQFTGTSPSCTADAPKAVPSEEGFGGVEKYRVPVRWDTAGTGFRSGVALVDAGLERGDRTDVWLDSQGRVTSPPKPDADIWLAAFAIGSGPQR
ncbi:hypothetical protein HRW13_13605 [Streptomyces lunaelactis]|uniref:hypothetical protein n=1 Tax=Streptomyces lunaelactis TaxID=1535768 RepID=UPI001585B1A2|nr:hypothetical protein [Streptomyces lunaelactis]NUK41895.1 hypothetical protein [Streptomyces lunaelactis]